MRSEIVEGRLSVAKPFTLLTVVFLLVWGLYAFIIAWSVPLMGRPEPEWLIPLDYAVTRANALPEDLSRAIGQAIFGVALAALAIGDQTFTARLRLILFVLILTALASSLFGLWYLKPSPSLAKDFVGAFPFLEVIYGMSRKVMELSLSLLGAMLGLKLLK